PRHPRRHGAEHRLRLRRPAPAGGARGNRRRPARGHRRRDRLDRTDDHAARAPRGAGPRRRTSPLRRDQGRDGRPQRSVRHGAAPQHPRRRGGRQRLTPVALPADLLDRVLDPLRVVFDAQERVSWPYLLGGCLFAVGVLGVRRAWAELHQGLLRRELWWSASSRADLRLIAVKALLALVLRVPWTAATLATTLWIGLRLHAICGPAPDLEWPRGLVGLVYTLVLFVVWDFSRYAVHRLMHTVPWLWSFHQVHHSANVLTPLTLYRTHPVETLLYDARGWLTTSLVAGVF